MADTPPTDIDTDYGDMLDAPEIAYDDGTTLIERMSSLIGQEEEES
jgi:hypothetical protein